MRKKYFLIIFITICIFEIAYFEEYLWPIYWGKIKVSGLACTCPDETVINGSLYLRWSTPDSLKVYNLYFSEIFVTERPASPPDWMGSEFYIIKGKVIGKRQVSEGSGWNPLFKVESWTHVDPFIDYFVKFVFGIQLLIMAFVYKKCG